MLRQLIIFALISSTSSVFSGEWTSSITGEYLTFKEDPNSALQKNNYLSAAIETEYYHEWNGGDDMLTFKPFYRFDQHDENRSHGDIRELYWQRAENDWDVLLGISKVYWGATEAVHLVDIINQTDQVENQDGEDKLGQPMFKLSLVKDWGVVDLFLLPGFRERTFPSFEGRPLFAVVDINNPKYESNDKERHVDYAARWSDTLGDWDIGLSFFKGTSREPRFIPVAGGKLQPLYEQIEQASIDVQSSIESWLFKLEAISRHGQGKRFSAAATGIEYTYVGVYESDVDVGLIVEYLFDDRLTVPFQNDVVVGARIALNDIQSSELLVSSIFDAEGDGQAFNVEGTRRIGETVKLSIEARGVTKAKPGGALSTLRKDDRLRVEATYYF